MENSCKCSPLYHYRNPLLGKQSPYPIDYPIIIPSFWRILSTSWGAIAAGAWIHHSFEDPWERLHRGQAQPLRLLMAGFMGVFARSTRHTRTSFLLPTRFTQCQGPNQRCCLQPGSLRQGRQVSMGRCKGRMVKSSIPSDRWMESQASRGCAGFYATLHWSRHRATGKTYI